MNSLLIVHVSGNLAAGFTLSAANFARTLLGEDVRELAAEHGRLVFRRFNDFIFTAHAAETTSSAASQSVLRDVGALCELLFGPSSEWDEASFDVAGAHDVLGFAFQNALTDLSVLVGGVNQIFLGSSTAERVDKLLTFLEGHAGIVGNSSAMLLGKALFHSRLGLAESRLILLYHQARPLAAGTTVRVTPVYVNGAWCSLYSVRLASYTVTFLVFMDQGLDAVAARFEEFRQSFLQSRLEIPTEEPPVLLRLFAKRETLALLYHNVKTGHIVFPQLRPCSDTQHAETMRVFWSCFSDGSAFLRTPGVKEFALVRDQYRFYSRSEHIHRIHVLFANDAVAPEAVPAVVSDILRNLKSYVGA